MDSHQGLVHRNPFYAVSEEPYTLPNGTAGTYYAIRGLRTAMVVPVFSNGSLGLISQWRYLYNCEVIEFPAGRVEPDEPIAVAARRELQEETGLIADQLDEVGWFAPCNGLTDEHCTVFLARGLTSAKQSLDVTEQIKLTITTIDDFEKMIDNHQIQDGMTLAAWILVKKML